MKRLVLLATALAVPAVLTAPGPDRSRRHRSMADVLADCRDSALGGWALVDHATVAVHDAYDHHSLWHLWETPDQSLAAGRGWSAQYNQALAQVLRQLGFGVVVVHASRVRGLSHDPWWQAGHTWLRVTHQGRTLDVCASRASNTAGRVPFVATTEVRPVRAWTRTSVSLALAPAVVVQAWRQIAGAHQARWLYRPFDQPL